MALITYSLGGYTLQGENRSTAGTQSLRYYLRRASYISKKASNSLATQTDQPSAGDALGAGSQLVLARSSSAFVVGTL